MKPQNLHSRLEDWDFGIGIREPANNSQIKLLENTWQIELPTEFRAFLLKTNGFDGSCGKWGFVIYDIDEIILFKRLNEESNGFLPDRVFQFGGDGGGEIFLLDYRQKQPFFGFTSGITGLDEFLRIGKDFNEFIENYYWTSINGFGFGEKINKDIVT